jgi:transcriptional regulator
MFSVALPQELEYSVVVVPQEGEMAEAKLDLLQGTLDVMVLQTLAAMGPMHGYGIARRIEQVSGNEVLLNQGTIYASLVRLQQRGWISAEWGTSENNRKAKFYSITRRGRKQLADDMAYWRRLSEVMARVLAMQEDVHD